MKLHNIKEIEEPKRLGEGVQITHEEWSIRVLSDFSRAKL